MRKIPFVNNKLVSNVSNVEIKLSDVDFSKYVDSRSYITITKSRASTILYNFIDHGISIYNGQYYFRNQINSPMVGFKLGSFSLTKKLGKSIHNSERNAKRMAKMRRKITAKKIRKTKVVKKTTSKATTGPRKRKK